MQKTSLFVFLILILSTLSSFSQEDKNINDLGIKIENILDNNNFELQNLNSKEAVTTGYFYSKGTQDSGLKKYRHTSSKWEIEVIEYKYKSNTVVENICNELKGAKDKSEYLGKSFVIILFIKNTIYEIYAPCKFSNKIWKKLLKDIEGLKDLYTDKVDCFCGGACR